ncbi:MAG TPA: flagellar basal-body MS-ring/collar protein FliF [Kofleriaceae bacterium]|nr:flagellar basal-body MS-ring/collar protein FliF [Kofleriaceae bacterium]
MYTRLETRAIPAHIKDGRLEVPSDREMEARGVLAVQAMGQVTGGYDKMLAQSGFGHTAMYENVAFKQAFEGELAHSISTLSPVENATVKVAFGKRTMLKDMAEPATASAIIRLRLGQTLSPEQVRGIRQMIAGSVDGLKTENVTMIDGSGKPLDAPELTSSDRKADIESRLSRTVTAFLEKATGVGKISVVTTADVDTSKVAETSELFDKDHTVILSHAVTTDGPNTATAGAVAGMGGIAGTQGNLPGAPAASVQPGVPGAASNGHLQETTNYNVGKVVRQTQMPDVRIQKLHLAVLVDYKTVDGKPVPRSDKELTDLTKLAKQAAGLQDARGDEIVLQSIPFVPDSDLAPVATPADEPGLPLLYVAAGGGGGLLLLIIIGVLLLRKKKGAPQLGSTGTLALPVPIGELERMYENRQALEGGRELPGLPAGRPVQERVLDVVRGDVGRAAGVLTAWLAETPAKPQLAKGAKS